MRSIVWPLVRGRASVETKTGSRSFVTEIIVSALGAGNSIFVTRFVGSVKSCLCQLLLFVGAIAKAKATAGMVPCSKMWSIQRLIIVHFALSITPPFEFEDGFCFLCTSKNIPQSSPRSAEFFTSVRVSSRRPRGQSFRSRVFYRGLAGGVSGG